MNIQELAERRNNCAKIKVERFEELRIGDYVSLRSDSIFFEKVGSEKLEIINLIPVINYVVNVISVKNHQNECWYMTFNNIHNYVLRVLSTHEISKKELIEACVICDEQECVFYVPSKIENIRIEWSLSKAIQDHICKSKTIDHGLPNQKTWVVCPICGKEM